MNSFQTEIEQAVGSGAKALVEKDIIDLEQKIHLFHEGRIDSEKFRSLRLARGVYGQRQPGVQMIRIKLPYGKMTTQQLLRIADVSDEYSTGKLHLTTRQDIQIHYVSLDRTPQLWAELEKDDITLREACGNTVRNITASPEAGIDPKEPFDVTPYADALFRYFLRNPVCQEMGRKFKIAFSSNDDDNAFTFMHDLGLLPRVQIINGAVVRGFKVVIGGGLGAQPFLAQTAFEFLAAGQLIPFTEALLRVYDRHGERSSRHKARIKYLVNRIGLANLLQLVEEERTALKFQTTPIDAAEYKPVLPEPAVYTTFRISEDQHYQQWKTTNVFAQRQNNWFAVHIRVTLGNISTVTIRKLAAVVKKYAADDIRITPGQNIQLRFVTANALPALYRELKALDLHHPGAVSTARITACPGTDTCNLGISNSTATALALEQIIEEEYPELIYNHDLKIKISGCMNSCGQHALANIGFHGSSLKAGTAVLPALQVLLGGGATGSGNGRIAEKIIKVPSKRAPEVLRRLFNDFEKNALPGEYFNSYYDRQTKSYFYQLLKPLADTTRVEPQELIDWGQEETFQTAIGIGECAGVMIDLIQTLLFEAEEKLVWAKEALESGRYADSIYHSYSVFISTAKTDLLAQDINCNTHEGILNDYDKNVLPGFREKVLQLKNNAPEIVFATAYWNDAVLFLEKIKEKQISITNR